MTAPTITSTLPSALTDHLDSIRMLCTRYHIRALYVFGSAVHGTFDPDTSDFDFMIDPGEADDVLGRLLDFSYDLERLVGREIDLITSQATADPRFLSVVRATRVPLYAA